MASSLRRLHALRHVQVSALLERYLSQTAGVELLDNATTILCEESERQLTPDAAGIYRSHVFPGLWIDCPALLAQRRRQLPAVLRKGLSSPERAAFIRRLQKRARPS